MKASTIWKKCWQAITGVFGISNLKPTEIKMEETTPMQKSLQAVKEKLEELAEYLLLLPDPPVEVTKKIVFASLVVEHLVVQLEEKFQEFKAVQEKYWRQYCLAEVMPELAEEEDTKKMIANIFAATDKGN